MLPLTIANALLGIVFYAVAVLVSLTQGRWYGRRALLVLGVLPILVIVPDSPWIFLPTILTSALLFIAAWGTMAGNGAVRPGLRTAEFSLGLLLFASFEVACGILLMLISMLPGANNHALPNLESRHLVLMSDGKVLLETQSPDSRQPTLHELDGSPVTDEKYVGIDANVFSASFVSLCSNLRSDRDRTTAHEVGDPHVLRNFFTVVLDNPQEATEYWYYLVGKDYFVGYDKLTRRRIGICDRDGFHPADHVPHPFPKPLQLPMSTYYVPCLGWIDGQLYGLDFSDRALRPFFTAPSGSIHAVVPIQNSGKIVYFAIALDQAIQILDLQGKPVVTIPYHHDRATSPGVIVATIPTNDHIFVEYLPTEAAVKPPIPNYMDEVDLQGNVLHSYSAVTAGYTYEAGWLGNAAYVAAPLLPAVIDALATPHTSGQDNSANTSSSDTDSWRTVLLVATGLGALAAAIAYRWSRQAGFGRNETLGWLIFTFCFGLPGLLAFRLAAPFPTRVSCPSCSRKRPLQTDQCPSCHQSWPAPASTGTEIFAESGC
jgi:hypothetical protein